jgi:NitT/TauT family transport system substrate-binding protein
MVRRDLVDRGLVRDYTDLRGRTMAVNARGVATEYGAALALERGGLQLGDVELVELSFTDMIAAFANQAIDAAIQNEPAATQAASRGVAIKWHEMGEVQPGIQFTVVLYAPDFARQEAARRWMVAYLQGVRDYNDAFVKHHGREEVVDILTRHTPLRDTQLYAQMGFAYIDPNGQVDATSLAEQLQWYVQQGEVPQPPDLRQALDASFVEFALECLGPYV